MASQCKQYAWGEILNGNIDLLTDTLKAIPYNSTYVPNKDDEFIDDGGADDLLDGITDTDGYTWTFGGNGRQTLAGKSVTVDDTDDEVVFDFNDITWSSVGGSTPDTWTGLGIVKEITNDADSPIICNNDLDSSVTTNGGDVTINVDAEGGVNLNT